MKKILSVLLCVTLVAVGVFAFSGCTKTSDLKYDVALITDGGSIHDKAYNQSAWDGCRPMPMRIPPRPSITSQH